MAQRLTRARASALAWWARFDRTNTLGLAAQVAFWLFLSLLPLAAVAGYILARLTTEHVALQAAVLDAFPIQARELVASELTAVVTGRRGTVGPLAAAAFVWLASGGVHAVFDALECQVGVERPWWKKKLLAIAACLAISVGAALIGLLVAGATWVFHLVGHQGPPGLDVNHGPAWRALRFVAILAVGVAVTAAVYALGTPPAARRGAPILPGAAFAVAFNATCAWGYGVYLATFGIGSGYEAGLAAIGVTLTSLYLLALGLLAGASLNQHLARNSLLRDG